MATTMISAVRKVVALDRYLVELAAKDAGSPLPTERAELVSTVGSCTPESFLDDLERTRQVQGKTGLKLKAYHAIISQTHEEADPADDAAGMRQHMMVRKWTQRAFPGHQAKLVTQRDNGRWIGEGADREWLPGKWHTHVIIASVSEREATLVRRQADGTVTERHYAAGRAIDGYMNGIDHLRLVTDEVVLEDLGYDNAKYIEACRAASRGERVTAADLSARATHGYSHRDEVRVRLGEARALATDWDDYTARLGAAGVQVRVTGKSGVSYAWVDEAGVGHKARSRGKNGLGEAFTIAEVEAQCERNRDALAAGQTLTPPAPVLAPPPLPVEQRPVPVYLTPDGRPPWERDLLEYEREVDAAGGTYEAAARQRLNAALADDWVTDRLHLEVRSPDHGIAYTEDDQGIGAVALETDTGTFAVEAAHLGGWYSTAGIDQQIDTRGRADHDIDTGGAAGGVAEAEAAAAGGDSTAGIAVHRVDGVAVASLRARQLAADARRRAEQHDHGAGRSGEGRGADTGAGRSEHSGVAGDGRSATAEAGRGAARADRAEREDREARDGAPGRSLRDHALRGNAGRASRGDDRGLGE